MDIGIQCSYCKYVSEIPREIIIEIYNKIMDQTPLPKEEMELFKQLKDLKVIFDVGAREDIEYLDLWPESEHHLFEPNPVFFEELAKKTENKPNVFANNYGLGDKEEVKGYNEGLQAFAGVGGCPENYKSDLEFPIKTLDSYVIEKDIKQIDFLKIDTEGYDLKVLLGATNWFHIIRFIQYEHWGKHNNLMIKGLLSEDFDTVDIGYRNVFCMNKKLVSEEERARLRKYIEDNKLGELV